MLDIAFGILEGLETDREVRGHSSALQRRRPMAEDALSNLLRTVRLTGATFFDVAAQDAWAVRSPARDAILPNILPGADHLIAYHVVTSGRCFARMLGAEAIPLEAGEVVVFAHGDPHVMSSGPGMTAEQPSADVLDIAFAGQMPFHINYADGGSGSTNLVCGYLACDSRPFNPLLDSLPPIIKAGDPRSGDGGLLAQFIRLAVVEVAEKRTGGNAVLTKLSELMFIDVLRQFITTLPPQKTGWLAALRDPSIMRALTLIHDDPAHDWTLEALARQCGMSRTAFAARFAEVLGMPPMQYIARWRMQVASELLSGGRDNLAGIAERIGYESEAAFSRAFKKIVGVAPSAWRQGMRSPRA
jgi:AraC-like DNA-binding protein